MRLELKENIKNFLVDKRHQLLKSELKIIVNPNLIHQYGMPFKKGDNLRKFILRRDKPYYLTLRKPLLLSGNWDLDVMLFKNYSTSIFIQELVENDLDYTRCRRYQDMIERVNRGEVKELKGKKVVLDSVESVNMHMQYYVEIIKSMSKNGFIEGLAKDSVKVMIGRDGSLIKEEHGRHRLAIAQVLDLNEITVKITHIHPEWVKKYQINGMSSSDIKVIKWALNNLKKMETVV
ncbi:hypothetical protein [Rhodohalobacter barkolensis]|uniref:ParB/Sulfiredoxin domain-containing protein n=1 Tax=Rhodohalobacter barkolensis TaxID=2053187 RepID=A0A2N0VGE4_9BACT|nr:hypothetical protein [Rhodohalobacter barkolensis]PKD43254.1 hypothetical protein CWD77_11610 [Rhodohalobacter barkolensis]